VRQIRENERLVRVCSIRRLPPLEMVCGWMPRRAFYWLLGEILSLSHNRLKQLNKIFHYPKIRHGLRKQFKAEELSGKYF